LRNNSRGVMELKNWKVIPFEPGEESQLGYIDPKEGIIAAAGKASLEHEKAHIELGHTALRRETTPEEEMEVYAYVLAKGRVTISEFLSTYLPTLDEENMNILRPELSNALSRLYRKGLITKNEYLNTSRAIRSMKISR